MRYLNFDSILGDDGVTTLEAMASTPVGAHAAVLAEAQQVLDWAWARFPHTHGPAEDGNDWDHALAVRAEDGGWHTLTLTLTASQAFVDEFQGVFEDVPD